MRGLEEISKHRGCRLSTMGAALSMALSLKSQDQQSQEEPDDDEELDDPMEDIEPDEKISQQIVTKSKKTKKKTTRKRKMKSKRKIIKKSQQITDESSDDDQSRTGEVHAGISESQLKEGYLMDGPIMYAAEILKYRQDLIPRLQQWRERGGFADQLAAEIYKLDEAETMQFIRVLHAVSDKLLKGQDPIPEVYLQPGSGSLKV